jgi:hypothetical protein
MALTVALAARAYDVASTHKIVFGTITFDSSYTTGGLSFTAADTKNLGEIELLQLEPATNATPVCIILKYDYTNFKILAFDMAGLQIANAVDLSAYSARFQAWGK